MNTQKDFLNDQNKGASLKEAVIRAKRLSKYHDVSGDIIDSLPFIQSYADVQASYPHHYDISNFDSFCLIYTEAGSGLLTTNKTLRASDTDIYDESSRLLTSKKISYTLKKETIAFIDCKQAHKIEIKKSLWSYKIFFIYGPSVSFFYNSFIEDGGNVHTFLPGTSVPNKIKLLYDYLSNTPNMPLIHSKYICIILFDLLIEKNRLREEHCICDYIYQIKHDFDCNYMEDVSLELLEQKYHVSKYHICREFKKRFLMTPIQYQNYRKIEVSKRMLLNTDKRINEIGRMVGFENPNNFIRNFKKHTAVTPSEYRKQHIADILVPSSRI